VWGDEIGWVNLAPTGSGVTINSATGALSGYAYANTGSWINFNPTDVSGGTDVGVSINSSGEFTGWAWVSGAYGGWMKFDCSSSNTCVKTDWRPSGSRVSAAAPASSGSVSQSQSQSPATPPTTNTEYENIRSDPAAVIPTFTRDNISQFFTRVGYPIPSFRNDPNHIESYNAPLTLLPYQSGLLVWDFTGASTAEVDGYTAVILEVPQNISENDLTFFASTRPFYESQSFKAYTVTTLGSVFSIHARDHDGVLVHSFAKPLTITLFIPEVLSNRTDIGLYYFDNDKGAWTRIKNVQFGYQSARFTVDHLTEFALLSSNVLTDEIIVSAPNTPWKPPVWVLALVAFLVLIFFKRNAHRRV